MCQVQFVYFSEPKRMKCECCDRLSLVEVKMLISRENRLAGDLDLCAGCGELLREVVAKETIEQEWVFGGGELLG